VLLHSNKKREKTFLSGFHALFKPKALCLKNHPKWRKNYCLRLSTLVRKSNFCGLAASGNNSFFVVVLLKHKPRVILQTKLDLVDRVVTELSDIIFLSEVDEA